jgi:NlpC/P60 family
MRQLGLLLLVTVLVAACSSAPQRVSRAPGGSNTTAANRTFATPSGFPNFVDHSVGREEISIQAMSLVGVPYRWGGNTPEAGFDCSGLVRYVVDRAASVNLPRTTADMSVRGEAIEPDQVAPGDLIFFNTTGRPHSHVGIYVGKLRFVNAPSTGGTVRLDYLTNPYWAKRFDGIRRVAAPTSGPFDSPTYLATTPKAPGDAGNVRLQIAAASSQYTPPPQPVATAQRQTVAAGAASGVSVPVGAAQPAADPFEPPPSSMPAAQRQAQAAGAVSPVENTTTARQATADSFEPPPPERSAAQYQAQTAANSTPVTSATPSRLAASSSPDPIDAAADAFEPPPPTARLAAEQARTSSAARAIPAYDPAAHVIRASTNPLAPTPSTATDDPIAKFANGGY